MLKLLKKTDFLLVVSIMVLLSVGLFSLLSSSPPLFRKQLTWLILGVLLFFSVMAVDLRSFIRSGGIMFILYSMGMILILVSIFFAPDIKGNRAWIVLGSIQFQPAEIVKVILILFLARYLVKKHAGIAFWGTLLTSFFYVVIPVFLIMLQPDFGSAAVIFSIWAGLVLFSGLPVKRVLVLLLSSILIFVILWSFVLKDYQKDRIISVFNPRLDPLGISYSVIQSKIAIGSGGILGKGFREGSQTQLGFLPEAQTDFIFAAIAEEGGLFAIFFLFLAFLLMLFRIIKIGAVSENNMLKFICLGSAVLFFVQFVLNVGSNIGFVPVIGVTLPFVSYGGSSILANLFLIGVIQSIYARR